MNGELNTNCFSKNRTEYLYRDAQGNILAIYDRRKDSVWLKEWDIYGSKRIGVVDTTMLVGTIPVTCICTQPPNLIDSSSISYLEGQKQYELTNHLGNVLVTLSDKKLPVDTTSTPNIANYYQACIVNAQDYYPFGMVEPGRQYSLYGGDSLYRFAFNGKLHDDDIYGKDNSYDYGNRFYDPRLGRFLSIDPLYKKYPMLTPYQFASLNPIEATDLSGNEAKHLSQDIVPFVQPPAEYNDPSTLNFIPPDPTVINIIHTRNDYQQDATYGPFIAQSNNSDETVHGSVVEPPMGTDKEAQTQGSNKAIMAGTYNVAGPVESPEGLGEVLILQKVPGRTDVEIHAGQRADAAKNPDMALPKNTKACQVTGGQEVSNVKGGITGLDKTHKVRTALVDYVKEAKKADKAWGNKTIVKYTIINGASPAKPDNGKGFAPEIQGPPSSNSNTDKAKY